MALVFLVVLLLIIVVRISSERATTANNKRQMENEFADDDARSRAWLSKVTNHKLEVDLEDRLYNREPELIDEIQNSWSDYFGFAYNGEQIYHPRKKTKVDYDMLYVIQPGVDSISDVMALRVLMANKGLLIEHDAEYGLSLGLYGDTEKRRQVNIRRCQQFVRAMDRKLREHCVVEQMYEGNSATGYRMIDIYKEIEPADYGTRKDWLWVAWRPSFRRYQIKE